MQTQGGADATAAIESQERQFFADLKVDWNRDGLFSHYLSDLSMYADEIVVDRGLAGAAPSELMLTEGSAAAELSFVIGGEDVLTDDGMNFTGIFSPYNGLSPFYNLDPVGCEIIYKIGVETAVGIIWYQQFIGNIRTITPNRGTGTVAITALDRVEKLRNPVQFPIWGMSEFCAQRGYEIAQLTEAQHIIDHCLRLGETSVTPYRPLYPREFTKTDDELDDGVRFWLTGTGGHTPLIGMMAGDQSQGFPDQGFVGASNMYHTNGKPHSQADVGYRPRNLSSCGPDNTGITSSAINSAAYLAYWGLDRNTTNMLDTHRLGFTMNNSGTNGKWYRTGGNTTTVLQVHTGFHIKYMITVSGGFIRGEVRNYNTNGGVVTSWWPLPDNDYLQIDMMFAAGGGQTTTLVGLLIDGTTQYSETLADWSSYDDGTFDPFTGFVTVEHRVGLQDVYWSTRHLASGGVFDDNSFTTHARRPAKYAAVLNQSLNRLTHLPVTNADDAWDIITQVAAAELGSVFWDENGIFRFWNRTTMVSKQIATVKTLNLDQVEGLAITAGYDSIRNVITSESTKGYARTEIGYESNSVNEFYVPANSTARFIKYLDHVQSVGSQKVVRYTNSTWDSSGDFEGYVVQWFKSGSWVEDNGATSGLDIFAYGNEDNSMTIYINNGYGWPARLATDGGAAAFRIVGSTVHTDETNLQTAMNTASVDKFGARNYALTGPWVQDVSGSGQATPLMTYVLNRTVQVIPTTEDIVAPGDPRIQLGDKFNVRDPDGLGEIIGLQVYGINRKFNKANGLTDQYTVEMLAPARTGVWDSVQYGIWGQTFYWSA